jgi:O-acetyl-ADP-ribose deacetylase (regulator of RNase III)/uncharacterized protein YwgA
MKILIGDIFKSEAQTLVNTVNCVGIMGKGVAAEFKKHFPEMFKEYEIKCEKGDVKPGEPYLYNGSLFGQQVINFPTKGHWRAASRIEDIENGLKILVSKYKEWEVQSIALPPLGCGNGQLLWEAVGPLMYKYLSAMDIPVEIYAPYGTPPSQMTSEFLSKVYNKVNVLSGEAVLEKLNPAWVALVEIVHRIENHKYHMPVGRTIFQKIAYVATFSGLPTGLQYSRGSYGPYSESLDDVKKRLSNAGMLQEKQLGKMFQIAPGTSYENQQKKYSDYFLNWNPIIDKTVDLFLRLDTRQAEIVASVLYVEKNMNKGDMSEAGVVNEVMKWKQKRNPPLNENEVAETVRNLGILKWYKLNPSQDLFFDN